MPRVAIVTDSAADLTPAQAAAEGISIVPLTVTFGDRSYLAGVDLTTEEFWRLMTAPDAPFPTTAAPAPGTFKTAFDAAFAAGADSIVYVGIAEGLSGTIASARVAAGMLPGREIHIVDSQTASMGVGLLALVAAEMARSGAAAGEIAAAVSARRRDIELYVALETVEYLRRGGRLSGPAAAVLGLLSIKPIITVREGVVVPADRVRTHSKARQRVIDLLAARPAERVGVLHAMTAGIEGFREELVGRIPGGVDPSCVSTQPLGPSIGPHVGPGAYGAVLLLPQT